MSPLFHDGDVLDGSEPSPKLDCLSSLSSGKGRICPVTNTGARVL